MANRYWVGGTGNWTNTARWSTTSGGAGGASVPTAADAAIFDLNSFAAPNQTVTVDVASVFNIFSLDMTALITAQNFNMNSKQMQVYGDKVLLNQLVNYTNTGAGIIFPTGASVPIVNIDYAGSNMFARLEFKATVTGVTYQLLSDVGTLAQRIASFDGSTLATSVFTLRTNNHNVFCNEILLDDKHFIDFGSSVIDVLRDCDLAFHDTGANNLTANNASMNLRSNDNYIFYLNNNQRFGTVNVLDGAEVSIYRGTVRALTAGIGSIINMSDAPTVFVTERLTLVGSAASPAILQSSVAGTRRSLDLSSAEQVQVWYASIKDNNAIPSGTAYMSTDGGNNQGWTFSAAAPPTTSDLVDNAPTPVIAPPRNRQLFFKIEKLNSSEDVLEERSVVLTDGNVEVGSGGFRRKCSFELLGGLPTDYQQYRWRLHYGYRNQSAEEVTYYPLGVFIPVNPDEREANDGLVTSFQGVDKIKLFADYQLDAPVKFTSGTTVRSIVQTVAGWFGETKLLLASDIGTLAADFTFEEGSTAEQLLDALITSFSAEWFYDPDGYLVARKRVAAALRPVRFVMDDVDDPQYLTSRRSIDETNYYNKLTLVGGKIDTPIYRTTLSDTAAIARAGGRVVQRYFTRDAAVTQSQVDGLAAFYLSNGVLLPSTLRLTSLVIPNLEVDDIISKSGVRYEVRSFNVPLGLGAQTITAGEIVT